jgi:hypothetical protein
MVECEWRAMHVTPTLSPPCSFARSDSRSRSATVLLESGRLSDGFQEDGFDDLSVFFLRAKHCS